MQQIPTTNSVTVSVDRDFVADRRVRKIVVVDADVDITLPRDVLIGHDVRVVAAAGDVFVHAPDTIVGSDADGDYMVPRGSQVEFTFTYDRCNRSRQWIPFGGRP